MTATAERPSAPPLQRESYFLDEVRDILNINRQSYWERTQGEFAELWHADNHEKPVHDPGRRGRKKRPAPRFDPEHIEFMKMALNGLMPEAEARDLWSLRKKQIPNELRAKTLASLMTKGAKK